MKQIIKYNNISILPIPCNNDEHYDKNFILQHQICLLSFLSYILELVKLH